MNYDSKDIALRVLIVAAGVIAAIVLTMQELGHTLPAVALGGAIGAFLASRIEQAASEDP
jgi:hypothetical protein